MLTQILSLDKFIFQSRPRYLKAEINLLKRKRNVTSTKTDLKYKYRNNFFLYLLFSPLFLSLFCIAWSIVVRLNILWYYVDSNTLSNICSCKDFKSLVLLPTSPWLYYHVTFLLPTSPRLYYHVLTR